jgi:hypothetical protein
MAKQYSEISITTKVTIKLPTPVSASVAMHYIAIAEDALRKGAAKDPNTTLEIVREELGGETDDGERPAGYMITSVN